MNFNGRSYILASVNEAASRLRGAASSVLILKNERNQKIFKMSLDKLGKHLALSVLKEEAGNPQFDPKEMEKLRDQLDERGVLYTVERVPVNELKVMPDTEQLQKEVVDSKINAVEEDEEVRPVIVSEDYYIIDGKHTARGIGEAKGESHKAPVFRVHNPASEVMGMLSDISNTLKEDRGDMNTVVTYPGRFQPFHRGHYKTYRHLVDRFGRNNTYIVTSDKVDPPRSPFSFRQKKRIITSLFDVPHENVVEVKNPYAPEEVLESYDEDDTAYVTAVSKKDKGRLLGGGGYFEEYTGENLEGYEDTGYVYTTPMAGFTFRGEEVSGSNIRDAFRSDQIPMEEKKDFFRYIYGSFDESIFQLMLKRIDEEQLLDGELIEEFVISGGVERAAKKIKRWRILQETTSTNSAAVDDGPTTWYETRGDYEDYMKEIAEIFGYEVLDYVLDAGPRDEEYNLKPDGLPFNSFFAAGIDTDPGVENPMEIYMNFATAAAETVGYEVMDWLDLQEDLRRQFEMDDTIAISVGDQSSGLEAPDEEQIDAAEEEEEHDTAEKVRDEDPNVQEPGDEESPEQPDQEAQEDAEEFEDDLEQTEQINEIIREVKRELLSEGGGHGHMDHPFEDLRLTFGDLKSMIELAFEGNLDIEEDPIEKVDGQNLMISWKDGDLCAARNKGHLKNLGADSMDLRDLVDKFEGRGAIREAFEYAFRDLSVALSRVGEDRLQEVFEEGKKWMSLEVIYPAAKNVIDYGDSFIVFHGIIEHDEKGNALNFEKDAAFRVADLVDEVNARVQDEFEILSPPAVDLPSLQLEDLRSELVGEVEEYQNQFDLSDEDQVMEWHEEWWENFVREKAEEFDYDIPDHVVAGFIRRWAWGNKSGDDGYSVRDMKSAIDHEDFISWAREFDKNDYKQQFKENIKPIEEVFLKLGTEVLKRVETVLATDPEHAEEDIQQQLQSVRAQLEGAADSGKIEKLQQQLSRLEKAGGIDDIALEGIVFTYKGKTFKLTGSWAPLNQVVGIMKYA